MKFKYKKSLFGALRPIIPVRISSGSVVADYEVLIDSGADISIAIHVGKISFDLKVGFVFNTGEFYGIVGQKGFFEAFKIAFDRKNQEIALTAHA